MTETTQEALRRLQAMIERFDQLGARAVPSPARDVRWAAIDQQIGSGLSGQDVLTVGPDAQADAEAFRARGARSVWACNSPADLESGREASFDLVHCNDLLHRVLEPMGALRRLRSATADSGTLLIGAMVLGDPERSEFLRFVPDRFAGDPNYWFVPGRLAFRWLVETAGFRVEAEFGEQEGPRDEFPVASTYLRAHARPRT